MVNSAQTHTHTHIVKLATIVVGDQKAPFSVATTPRCKGERYSFLRKRNFFPSSAVVSILLLYGCTTWTLTKGIEKKLDGNCTKMLQSILIKSWMQNPTKQKPYGHLLLISKTIKIEWIRHAEHCWRRKDQFISDVLRWTPSLVRASVGRPTKTYLQQLCTDTGCSLEDLSKAMDERDGWWESQRNPYLQLDLIIYIYILSLKKKPKTGYFRIINLFPSCFVFLM